MLVRTGFAPRCARPAFEADAAAVLQIRDSIDAGYAACMQLMANRPHLSAIFSTNDLLAIGAAQALITLGRKVPDDVSVIGIADIQFAHQVHPALTTVAIQTAAIAALSVDQLIQLLQVPEVQPSMVIAQPPELVVRASIGPRRAGST